MTLPLGALGLNPYDENQDNVPSWRKAALRTGYQQQTSQQTANSPYSTIAQSQPLNTLNQSLATTTQMGADATANAQAGATVKKSISDAYQQQQFNTQQQQAQQAWQVGANQQLTALQTKYTNLANQIPGNQQYGATPSYNPPHLSGVGAPGQPVQYSGQAAQVAQMARNAGFPEGAIATAVAISQAESSGNASAVNNANSNGTSDYGLMQINSVHSDLLKGHDWKDPQQNMDMAYQIYKSAGGSFSPWSTYNNGAYNKFMGMGSTAASAIVPSGPVSVSAQTTSGLRTAIIDKAETYIGLPYVWGGTDLSKGVDCSGLVQSVYKKFGLNLPRTSYGQYGATAGSGATWGVRTNVSQLEPGDLVYFKHSDGQVHHVAIWLGNSQILEAPYTGANVRIRTLGKGGETPYGVHLYGLDSAGSKATGSHNAVAI